MPTDSSYDPAAHLSLADVVVDNPSHPEVIRVFIKTDPFRKGINLYMSGIQ